jgi:large subunit ribosomal protein L6
MSRIASKIIPLPSGVSYEFSNGLATISGKFGKLDFAIDSSVNVALEDNCLKVTVSGKVKNTSLSGTVRSILSNMVEGVTTKFTKTLDLVGVGYRAQIKGKSLDLSLGFSHPVLFEIPDGVDVEMPANNKIVLTSIDKRLIGQVAAEIRSIRPPEPYKGKGVKYSDEVIIRKETKKK